MPDIIVKVGPLGKDVAEAYLNAGGDPAALETAAGWGLRQAAARPDGTLDPAKIGAWADKRSGFLSVIPDVARKFTAAADAQRAVDVAVAAEAAGLKAGAKLSAETVTGATKEAAAGLKAAQAAGQARLKAVTAEARDTLKEVTQIAQRAVDDTAAARVLEIREREKSAVGRYLGEADPAAATWTILNDKTNGAAKARQLTAAAAGDPAARAGLSRLVGEAIERNLVGVPKGVTSVEGGVAANRLHTLITHAEPPLAEMLSPADLAGLKAVDRMMTRDFTSAQVGTGSPTAQLTATRGGIAGKAFWALGRHVSTGTISAGIGVWLGNFVDQPAAGGLIGGATGLAIEAAVKRAREAGIQNVADLKAAAYLNPPLFRILTTEATPKNRTDLAGALAAQLKRMSLVSATTHDDDRERRALMPLGAFKNFLFNDLAGAPPENRLLH